MECEIKKEVFNAGDAKFIHEIVEEAATKATLNALKCLKSEEREKEKKRYDRRLRNTELLLKNYRNFKEHAENAIYLDNELENESLEDELDEDANNDKMYINSILKTKKRTQIILKHIDRCLEYYECKCLSSEKEEVQRRIKVIKMLYIDDEKMSYFEVAKKLGEISTKTIERAKKVALSELTVLFFGIDGVKL